jgi:hypothetical protein
MENGSLRNELVAMQIVRATGRNCGFWANPSGAHVPPILRDMGSVNRTDTKRRPNRPDYFV